MTTAHKVLIGLALAVFTLAIVLPMIVIAADLLFTEFIEFLFGI